MAEPLPAADPSPPKKRGPKTPEGKARSRMNALKHGLRAREFGLLPEESPEEWALHLADLRAGLGPADAYEEKLVAAMAAAMWREVRADRVECDVMAEIPPLPDRSHGGDLQEPRHAASLTTAIRYMTAAGMAAQRAQRALLAHRKARKDGFAPAVAAPLPGAEPANQDEPAGAGPLRRESEFCTNELPAPPPDEPGPGPRALPGRAAAAAGPTTATATATASTTRPGWRPCPWSRPTRSGRPSAGGR
jgi:hypothetical protein